MKLVIETKDSATRLYNLDRDIGEKNNLANSMTAKLEDLEKLRVAWDAELIPPIFEGLPPRKRAVKK